MELVIHLFLLSPFQALQDMNLLFLGVNFRCYSVLSVYKCLIHSLKNNHLSYIVRIKFNAARNLSMIQLNADCHALGKEMHCCKLAICLYLIKFTLVQLPFLFDVVRDFSRINV